MAIHCNQAGIPGFFHATHQVPVTFHSTSTQYLWQFHLLFAFKLPNYSTVGYRANDACYSALLIGPSAESAALLKFAPSRLRSFLFSECLFVCPLLRSSVSLCFVTCRSSGCRASPDPPICFRAPAERLCCGRAPSTRFSMFSPRTGWVPVDWLRSSSVPSLTLTLVRGSLSGDALCGLDVSDV